MKSAMMTPSERLRPHMNSTRIERFNGSYVIRQCGVRMDPHVTAGERRFDHAMERLGVAAFWFLVVPGTAAAFYWGLIEGSKLVFSFAFNHPIGR